MNTDQQARLEIMLALRGAFPDRLLEELIHVARYVEAGGIERACEESQDSAAKSVEEATDIPEPRTWMKLERIPDDVRAVTDPDGDVIRRVALGNRPVWKYKAARYEDVPVIDAFAPFTEVLS